MGYLLAWLPLQITDSGNLIIQLKPAYLRLSKPSFQGRGRRQYLLTTHLSYYLFISLSSHCWFPLVFWQLPCLKLDKFNLDLYVCKEVTQFNCRNRCNQVVSARYTHISVLHLYFCHNFLYRKCVRVCWGLSIFQYLCWRGCRGQNNSPVFISSFQLLCV